MTQEEKAKAYDKAIERAKKLYEQGEQKPILNFKAKDWYVSKVDGKIHNIYHSVENPFENPSDSILWGLYEQLKKNYKRL